MNIVLFQTREKPHSKTSLKKKMVLLELSTKTKRSIMPFEGASYFIGSFGLQFVYINTNILQIRKRHVSLQKPRQG